MVSRDPGVCAGPNIEAAGFASARNDSRIRRTLRVAQGDLVKNQSSVVHAPPLSRRHPFVPWIANLAYPDESGQSDPPRAQQTHYDSTRVLIVNDDMHSAARLRQTLLTLGFSETMVAYSGKRALAAVCGYSPAVAIVDLELCDMTGYSLAHSLRSHLTRQVREIPLIAVAEHSGFGVGELARAAGFLGLLSKPVPSWLLQGLLLRGLR